MATCSITDNIVVNNPMVLVKYAEAMEEFANTREPLKEYERNVICENPDELKAIFNKWQALTKESSEYR